VEDEGNAFRVSHFVGRDDHFCNQWLACCDE
jgi:hypothetical protein